VRAPPATQATSSTKDGARASADKPPTAPWSDAMVEANLADYSQLAEVQRQLAESLLKKDEGEQHSLRQARPLPRPLPRLLPRPLPCPRAAPAPRVL